MSTAAIEKVVNDLKELPEADQELVLGFLHALKHKHGGNGKPTPCESDNPAIKRKDGMLVFTGSIGDPNIDWLKVVREERDEEILRQALGQTERK